MIKLFKKLAKLAPDIFQVIDEDEGFLVTWNAVVMTLDVNSLIDAAALRHYMHSFLRAKWIGYKKEKKKAPPQLAAYMLKRNEETCDTDLEIAFLAYWEDKRG